MASVYLQGGPCNGKTVTLTPAEADTGELICGGDLYKNPYTGQRHGGNLVFIDSGKAPQPGGGGGGPYAPRGTKAWDDFRGSVNRGVPYAVTHMGRFHRATVNALSRRSRVKH